MEAIYGKMREEDLPILKSAIEVFKKEGLKAGLHGTSLWNAQYKDVDVLVISTEKSGLSHFRKALGLLKKELSANVLQEKGNEEIGLDYDLEIGKLVLHVSYVVLL